MAGMLGHIETAWWHVIGNRISGWCSLSPQLYLTYIADECASLSLDKLTHVSRQATTIACVCSLSSPPLSPLRPHRHCLLYVLSITVSSLSSPSLSPLCPLHHCLLVAHSVTSSSLSTPSLPPLCPLRHFLLFVLSNTSSSLSSPSLTSLLPSLLCLSSLQLLPVAPPVQEGVGAGRAPEDGGPTVHRGGGVGGRGEDGLDHGPTPLGGACVRACVCVCVRVRVYVCVCVCLWSHVCETIQHSIPLRTAGVYIYDVRCFYAYVGRASYGHTPSGSRHHSKYPSSSSRRYRRSRSRSKERRRRRSRDRSRSKSKSRSRSRSPKKHK